MRLMMVRRPCFLMVTLCLIVVPVRRRMARSPNCEQKISAGSSAAWRDGEAGYECRERIAPDAFGALRRNRSSELEGCEPLAQSVKLGGGFSHGSSAEEVFFLQAG